METHAAETKMESESVQMSLVELMALCMAMNDSELTRDMGVEAGGLGALEKMCALMRSTMLSAAETTEGAAGLDASTALRADTASFNPPWREEFAGSKLAGGIKPSEFDAFHEMYAQISKQ